MKAFGDLVTTHGLEVAKSIVTRAVGDSYTRRINPWELVEDANKWIGVKPKAGGTVQVQRGVVDEASAQDWGKDGAKALLGGAE